MQPDAMTVPPDSFAQIYSMITEGLLVLLDKDTGVPCIQHSIKGFLSSKFISYFSLADG